ncbi:MAG TPA: sulfotransferase domain-containing protein, partial [Anaerolineae bacterium]|nr:sulfotransferase domain-containing protein [Anaerolineae bacterium]
DIAIPDRVLHSVLEAHSFRVLAGGRQPGEEDTASHYRKGIAGDWRNHFTDAHVERFKAVSNDLVTLLGYEW